MESTGLPDRVQVTEEMQLALGKDFDLTPRGEIEVKGKGRLRTWLLVGRKAASPALENSRLTPPESLSLPR